MDNDISDEEVNHMRAAGIPVPASHEEVAALLEEAEADPRMMDLDEAFRKVGAIVKRRIASIKKNPLK